MERFKDKVVIVTGATSGIGRAAAGQFAREGALLIIAGRRVERGEALVKELREQGETVDFVACDVSKQEDTDALVNFAIEKYGRIDVLCNNAGYGGHEHYLTHEYDDAVCKKYFETNVYSTLHLCRAVIPHMLERGAGSIVNTSSLTADLAVPFDSLYGATKGAIQSFTRTIAVEYGKSGIRCNCVLPGLTRTEMIPDGSEIENMVADMIPLGRIGTADEVAAGILFLASDEAGFCTGVSLRIDGGQAVF